jgi:hypothetical protein
VVLKRTGRLSEAKRLLSELRVSAGRDSASLRRATFHLGEIAMVCGEWQEAGELLQACLSVAPDHEKAAFDIQHAKEQRLPAHLAGLALPRDEAGHRCCGAVGRS